MKLSTLFETLEKSDAYKSFKKSKEGKSASFCAGFFILRIKQGKEDYSLDFRDDKNIFAFKIPESDKENIILQKEDLIPNQKPLAKIDEKLIPQIKIDIESVSDLVQKELKKNKIDGLEEIIAVLQHSDEHNKLVWHLTCMSAGFNITIIIVDALTGEVLKFNKKNLMEFVNIKKGEKK